jgi:excinuclease ABC subunit B
MSDAMKEAISETDRRRKRRSRTNEAHGITPTTIKKAIATSPASPGRGQDRRADLIDVLKKSYNVFVPAQRKQSSAPWKRRC